MEPAGCRWLLLIHQLPPKPDYLRVKVRRRLQRLGAVLFKSSVYVLPASDEMLEDFQWLLDEIVADGGDATICAASLLSGVSDEDIEESFRAERDAEYRLLAKEARDAAGGAESADRVARLRRKLEAIERRDWFAAPEKAEAERALWELERQHDAPAAARPSDAAAVELPHGATWVTRKGVFVDRIASAWLIRRFIDPAAAFRFVAPEHYRSRPGELRFDMYGGEFTHQGDRCTFERLLAHFGLDDPALRAIAEIVHDIDCKDEKFGREEAAGIAAVLEGIALSTADDEERIARGTLVFDGLYGPLRRPRRT
jgi:hypothetical protein